MIATEEKITEKINLDDYTFKGYNSVSPDGITANVTFEKKIEDEKPASKITVKTSITPEYIAKNERMIKPLSDSEVKNLDESYSSAYGKSYNEIIEKYNELLEKNPTADIEKLFREASCISDENYGHKLIETTAYVDKLKADDFSKYEGEKVKRDWEKVKNPDYTLLISEDDLKYVLKGRSKIEALTITEKDETEDEFYLSDEDIEELVNNIKEYKPIEVSDENKEDILELPDLRFTEKEYNEYMNNRVLDLEDEPPIVEKSYESMRNNETKKYKLVENPEEDILDLPDLRFTQQEMDEYNKGIVLDLDSEKKPVEKYNEEEFLNTLKEILTINKPIKKEWNSYPITIVFDEKKPVETKTETSNLPEYVKEAELLGKNSTPISDVKTYEIDKNEIGVLASEYEKLADETGNNDSYLRAIKNYMKIGDIESVDRCNLNYFKGLGMEKPSEIEETETEMYETFSDLTDEDIDDFVNNIKEYNPDGHDGDKKSKTTDFLDITEQGIFNADKKYKEEPVYRGPEVRIRNIETYPLENSEKQNKINIIKEIELYTPIEEASPLEQWCRGRKTDRKTITCKNLMKELRLEMTLSEMTDNIYATEALIERGLDVDQKRLALAAGYELIIGNRDRAYEIFSYNNILKTEYVSQIFGNDKVIEFRKAS